MSNYNNYPCWDCVCYHNCGRSHIETSYKFNRDGYCKEYRYDRQSDDIITEKRKRDFTSFIEYLEDNRISRW